MYRTIMAAGGAICAATLLLSPVSAEAKPQKVCFKTANGKNYISRGNPGGFLHTEAKSCSGDAVFIVYHPKSKKRSPRFSKPVVIMSAKHKRYVWLHLRKKMAFAVRKNVKAKDKRFFLQIDPVSGAGKGAPIRSGVKVNLASIIQKMPLYAPEGGGEKLAVGKLKKKTKKWGSFTIVRARK